MTAITVVQLILIVDLLPSIQILCKAIPLQVDIPNSDQNYQELLHHFGPILSEDGINEVQDVLQQLHRHAKEKRFRLSSAHGRTKPIHSLDLENNNITWASLNETEGNITVDINTDEKSPPDASSASGFARQYLFEGDILLTPEQGKRLLSSLSDRPNGEEKLVRRRQKRTALISGDDTRWRSLPIRYNFDSSVAEDDRLVIKEALEYWQSHTCVWFQHAPGATDGDYISFFRGNGCYSMVGKVGGKQSISIGDGCAQLGVVAHEVGHSLGMWHEQSRPDSERYIRVIPQNIIDGALSNFLQRTWGETSSYSVSYDLGSVMHYGPTAFAVDDDKYTIETLVPGYQHTVGQREHPSFLDVMAINKAYCDNRCSHKLSCYHGGYTHPLSCNECICPGGLAGTFCDRPADPKNANCGGIIGISDEWTTITSPNYPKNYGQEQRCVWLLRADPGARILFQFVDKFALYCSPTCLDYVEIKNDTDFTKTGMRFCCNDPPVDPFYSSTNEMLVVFSSQTTTDLGFKGQAIQYGSVPPTVGGSIGTTITTSERLSSTETSTESISTITSALTTISTTSTVSVVTSIPATSTTITPEDTSTSTSTITETSSTTPTGTSTTSISTTTETTSTSSVPSTSETTSSTSLPLLKEITSTDVLVTATNAPGSPWNTWSSWSACSKTCGACGVKSRQRECLDGSCTGESKQFKRCPLNICPGDTTCNKLTFLDFPCGDGGRVCSSVHEVSVKCNFPSCCSPYKPGKTLCELPRTRLHILR